MPTAPHPKPRQEGETDAAYNKRVANWKMSQQRLSSVGITGGVNKASKEQLDAFTKKYGHVPSGLKPVQGPTSDAPPDNPKPPKPPKPPSGGPGGNGGPQRGPDQAGQSATGRQPRDNGGFGGPNGALGAGSGTSFGGGGRSRPTGSNPASRAGLSQIPTSGRGRRAQRRARQMARRGGY